ncbi:MAG: gamma-glutamylcyclotransferase [Gammaproteobacteria bacterium]|nr:MAG: gamma-glutamylcyclotransferase [Gammaproteobacteria bacterium]
MYDSNATEQKLKSDYLFVYGTLRGTCESDAHKEYLRGADFVSPAKIRGKLYLVDYYPGLVLSETEHWALGEVYLIENEAQLHDLDVYEGCAKNSPQPHEYERRIVSAVLSSGENINAWAYIYKQDTSKFKLIESGDFLEK